MGNRSRKCIYIQVSRSICYINYRFQNNLCRYPARPKYIEPNRHCTLFLYLSDVVEGGETVFPYADRIPDSSIVRSGMSECSDGLAIRPQKRSGVLFYSKHPNGENDLMSFHGGCPPVQGKGLYLLAINNK